MTDETLPVPLFLAAANAAAARGATRRLTPPPPPDEPGTVVARGVPGHCDHPTFALFMRRDEPQLRWTGTCRECGELVVRTDEQLERGDAPPIDSIDRALAAGWHRSPAARKDVPHA